MLLGKPLDGAGNLISGSVTARRKAETRGAGEQGGLGMGESILDS
jgi:hypothetical protein